MLAADNTMTLALEKDTTYAFYGKQMITIWSLLLVYDYKTSKYILQKFIYFWILKIMGLKTIYISVSLTNKKLNESY